MTGMSRNEKLGDYMKIPLIILVVFLFCCSCGPGKRLPVQTENRDSIRVEVREKTVYIRDTVYMTIPAQSAENTTRDTSSHLETDYAESDARLILTARCIIAFGTNHRKSRYRWMFPRRRRTASSIGTATSPRPSKFPGN